MKRMRLLLLPVAVLSEILLLAACWVLVPLSPHTSEAIVHWCNNTLPDFNWYFET